MQKYFFILVPRISEMFLCNLRTLNKISVFYHSFWFSFYRIPSFGDKWHYGQNTATNTSEKLIRKKKNIYNYFFLCNSLNRYK